MSLESLQKVIDRSLERATPLTRELFASRMSAPEVRDFINSMMSASIATVGATGGPHASLTLIACGTDGEIYFAANRRSALFRNLERSPFIAITVDAPEHGLMAQGTAHLVGTAPELREGLLPQLDAMMKRGRWVPEDWAGAVFQVELSRIFAQ